eukprot:jgi/Ulvmu1/8386/UM042_0093.1
MATCASTHLFAWPSASLQADRMDPPSVCRRIYCGRAGSLSFHTRLHDPGSSVGKSARTSRDMPQFVVVGAGPAGCTAALRAARTPDVQVTVVEKRSFDSIFTSRNSARSYPMVLSGRALQTLSELHLDLPSTREPYYGIQFLPSSSTMSMSDPKSCCLVSRSQLALNLLYEVASHPNISLHFSSSVTEIDLPKQQLILQQSSMTDDSALVLQHLIGEGTGDAAQHGDLYRTSQPLDQAHVSSGPAKSHSSELSEHSDASTTVPELAVLSRQASSSSAASEGLPHAGHDASGDTQPMPPGHSQPAAVRPPMSSVRMAGMQAALAVQARNQPALPHTLQYDLLIGADGANSVVRAMLVERGVLTVEETFVRLNFGYKTVTDVRIPDAAREHADTYPFVDRNLSSNQKLFFITAEGTPDIKLVLWRSDSDHVCGMVPGSAAALGEELSTQRLAELFGSALPPWFLQPFCDQFNSQPLSPFGTIRRCSQMHGPGVVLLGDSAHAVTSGLGQGCNMALESVRVFGEVLQEAGGQVADVPARFTATRHPDALAMQELELMCMLLQSKSEECMTAAGLPQRMHAAVALGAATLVGFAQWKLMPGRFRTIPVYGKLYDDSVSYTEVLGYVQTMGRGAYVVLGTVALAIGYNLVQVVSGAMS